MSTRILRVRGGVLIYRDFEWLDPSSITTSNGHLVITMTQESIHDLNFKSGMIQSWSASFLSESRISY